jgi:predicted nucleic acid-binding protein
MILVDTNVILDIVTDDPKWASKSTAALKLAAAGDRIAISEIIFAELSAGYDRIEDLEQMLQNAGLALAAIPRAALFLAGKAFLRYRRSAGTKSGVLSDFFIGAHAAATRAQLLTRDTRLVRSYFPSVPLIEPR